MTAHSQLSMASSLDIVVHGNSTGAKPMLPCLSFCRPAASHSVELHPYNSTAPAWPFGRIESMATGKQPTPQEAAGELFGMLRRGGKDAAEAALYMDSILGRWMDRYFQRMGVSEAEAEEMTMDVWVKVLKGQYEDRGNGYALLCRIRKSRFVEYLRYRSASKRSTLDGGVGAQRAEITGDDDLWDLLNESAAADEPPSDLLDCVKRKMFVYEQVSPGRAALLEMIADGLSYKEIAAVLFDKAESDVDAKEVARVRNRIEEARKQAAQYFEECKESS